MTMQQAPNRLVWIRARWAARGLCVLLPVLGGCGPDRPEMVQVSGRVTFGGGAWPKPGTLYFTPAEPAGDLPRRPGVADFDTDGYFTVKSFEDGEGLIPGRYLVGVECWEVPPSMGGPPPVSYLDSKYQNPQTSGLELDIERGQDAERLELDIPK